MAFTVPPRLNCEAARTLASWNLQALRQILVSEGLSSSVAEELVIEYKYYWLLLIATSLLPGLGQRLPPSPAISRVWALHAQRLSDDYCNYCYAVQGAYAHYWPLLPDDYYLYPQTVACYELRFGQPDERYWPKATAHIMSPYLEA